MMAAERLTVEVACRVLSASVSGFYAWRSRPPSKRAIRHAWLTDVIEQVHADLSGCVRVPACPRRTHDGPRHPCLLR